MRAVRFVVIVVMLCAGMSEAVAGQEMVPRATPATSAIPSGSGVSGRAAPPVAGRRVDFGDYSSLTLTVRAWEALGRGDAAAVAAYTKMCITLYEAEAKQQQASLKDFASKEHAFEPWALNDVATCYFILGESLRAQRHSADARSAFERIIAEFGFAQCWDPRGWFWKVTEGARIRLTVLP